MLAQASGGTVTTSGAYTIHTFTSGGSLVVSSSLNADVIIIGGGGGGGAQHAAGGGAGGMLAVNSLSVGTGSYSIAVGAGGNGCPAYGTYSGWSGQDGGNSSAFGYTALGGGAGGGTNGNNGGCGGGANASAVNGFAGTPGSGSQGYNGAFNNTDALAGGGGGGLGSAGSLSTGGSAVSTWAGTFGGGGGGGYVGGSGGAGAGAGGSGANAGGSASANTGSGGGGGGNFSAAGGNGGSGIVIVRYLTPTVNRSVNISMPATPIYAGQSLSIQASASTDATDGEQIGFFHYEYSTNGGSSWNAVAYDVNVGGSATRTANFTAGAIGSTVMLRVRIAFRGGAAGDVDYAGNAINWSGSWNSWLTPPTKYGSAEIRTALIGTASSAGLHHLKGEIVKSGNPGDAQDFGDGVIVEVFKHAASSGADTVLWSSLLARPNASHPAKVNLTASLATGDSLRYRLVSHTGDTNYDAVTFPSAFVMKTASIYTQNLSSGSTLGQINTAIGNAITEMNNVSTTYDRAEVVLASGTYPINDTGAAHGEALLAINGTKNVTLRGPGAKLVIGTNGDGSVTEKMFLTTESSSNIEVADLEFDYTDAALPYIQGMVTGSSGSTRTISLTWAPADTGRFVSSLFCYKYNPSNTAQVLDPFDISSCSISGSTATVTLSAGTLAINDVVVMSIRGDTSRLQEAALRVNSSTDATFRDVTLRAGGWISMIGKHNNGLHLTGYDITRAPSSSRIITTNGDGVRLNDSLRGPSIEDCHFERMMDDGINIHAGIRPATPVSGTVFSSADLGGVKIGDTLKVFKRNGSGVAANYATPYVVTGISGSNVTVDGTIPSLSGGDTLHFVNVAASGEGFLIRSNVIENTRFRGALIQTGYGFIVGNEFNGNYLYGISFEANLSGSSTEGAYPHHTPVQANEFTGNGHGHTSRAIRIMGDGAASPMYEVLAAAITGNVFNGQTSAPVDKSAGSENFNSGANTINP